MLCKYMIKRSEAVYCQNIYIFEDKSILYDVIVFNKIKYNFRGHLFNHTFYQLLKN